MAKKYPSLVERIIANSVMLEEPLVNGTPCWFWMGSTVKSRGTDMRYARMTIRVNGKPQGHRVTRLVLREFVGVTMRKDRVAAHLCNNSMCVNPGHLKMKTQSGNMQQCVADGRHRGFGNREPGED